MHQTQCRHFNGYKPCGLNTHCDSHCPKLNIPQNRILIVHLGAIGAVVRGTSILQGIHRKYVGAHITWVTDAPSHQLLKHNSLIDRVLTTSAEDLLVLRALQFDIAFVVDKSMKAAGVLSHVKVSNVFGFKVDPSTGSILPANPEAEELWEIGLSDFKKFHLNQKTENQLMFEALGLGEYGNDEYNLQLTIEELLESKKRNQEWSFMGEKVVLGFNTGCSPTIPYKKWTVDFHKEMIQPYLLDDRFQVVLLGGPEDTERNRRIADGLDGEIILSSTENGLRDGLVSVSACDIVVSGDSLGMHMAIAMKKFVVAWFGPTCAHEIELYGRGVALKSQASCGPCWKRTCQKETMCYDLVLPEQIMSAIEKGYLFCLHNQQPTSLSKPPFLETSSLVLPL